MLPACSSQSHITSCLSLMSHYWVNNKCNSLKQQPWRCLIYNLCNFSLHNSMLHVFTSNHHWKKVSQIPQENTCVALSFQKRCRHAGLLHVYFSPCLIIHVVMLLWISERWFMKSLKKTIHFTTNINIYIYI